jgi:hypothetical protein
MNSFLALSLSSIGGHCQSSSLSNILMSVLCPWTLIMMTDPGPGERQTTIIRIKEIILALHHKYSISLGVVCCKVYPSTI